MTAPTLVKEIEPQIVNELAAFGPLDLKPYFSSDQTLIFSAEQTNGLGLPKGMICTSDGSLTGIPAKNTAGAYEFVIFASNADGVVQAEVDFTINPSLATTESSYFDKLKAQVWEALGSNLPVPEMNELISKQITISEVYYLLERWAALTVWDAFNLEPAGKYVPLELEGQSKHYHVYDRGNSIVAAPKDLYSHERTILDALETSKAIAREVYKRGWTVEIVGFEKMMRAFWVEAQLLGDRHGKALEILHFDPDFTGIKLYNEQAKHHVINKLEQSIE